MLVPIGRLAQLVPAFHLSSPYGRRSRVRIAEDAKEIQFGAQPPVDIAGFVYSSAYRGQGCSTICCHDEFFRGYKSYWITLLMIGLALVTTLSQKFMFLSARVAKMEEMHRDEHYRG
ncbi:Uncharacterized protein Fot_42779 [Forsythia ovata]|uniref:Uncharacterized protein n=1 Tax=Forsythia ovata TaxID=205694 RepID=A0ABD1RNP6_9LAMI